MQKDDEWWEVILALKSASMGANCGVLQAEFKVAHQNLLGAQKKFDDVASRAVKRIAEIEKAALKASKKSKKK